MLEVFLHSFFFWIVLVYFSYFQTPKLPPPNIQALNFWIPIDADKRKKVLFHFVTTLPLVPHVSYYAHCSFEEEVKWKHMWTCESWTNYFKRHTELTRANQRKSVLPANYWNMQESWSHCFEEIVKKQLKQFAYFFKTFSISLKLKPQYIKMFKTSPCKQLVKDLPYVL